MSQGDGCTKEAIILCGRNTSSLTRFLFSLSGLFIRSLYYVSFDTDTGHVMTYKARPRGTGRKWLVKLSDFEWRPYDCIVPVVDVCVVCVCVWYVCVCVCVCVWFICVCVCVCVRVCV